MYIYIHIHMYICTYIHVSSLDRFLSLLMYVIVFALSLVAPFIPVMHVRM